MATSNRSGRNTSAIPQNRATSQEPTAEAVSLNPSSKSAFAALSDIEDASCRLNFLLTVVEYAINARRVLDDFSHRAQFDPPFSQALKDACGDWLDPDADGELPSALVHLLSMSRDQVREVQASVELLHQLRVRGVSA